MDTKKVYSKVEDFLKDDGFIRYVLDDAPEDTSRWEEELREHTGLLGVFDEARSALLALEAEEPKLTKEERHALKQRIFITLEIENMNY